MNLLSLFIGPQLPTILSKHSMVPLGYGQALIGGFRGKSSFDSIDPSANDIQTKVIHLTCSNRNCTFSFLKEMLSMPRQNFVAIPIPDTISGCITGGKNIKTVKTYYFMTKYVSFNTML